jgi:chromosome segregation ATPase
LRDEVRALKAAVGEKEAQVPLVVAELDALRAKFAEIEQAATARRQRLAMEIEVRASEMDFALRQLEQREGEIWTLKDEADRNAARFAAGIAAAQKKDEEMGDVRKEIDRLRRELGQSAKAIADAAARSEPDRKRIAQLETELKNARASYAKINAELTREKYLRKERGEASIAPRTAAKPAAPTEAQPAGPENKPKPSGG